MKCGNLRILLIFLIVSTTTASWISEWIREHLDEGFLKEHKELVDALIKLNNFLHSKISDRQSSLPSTIPVTLAPLPQVISSPRTEVTQFATTTVSPQRTTTKTLTTSTVSSSTATQKPLEIEPTTVPTFLKETTVSSTFVNDDTISRMKSVFTSYWTVFSLLVVITVIFSFYCVCVCCKRRHKKPDAVILPQKHLLSIYNKPYFYLHEHLDALKYNVSYEIARSNLEIRDFIGHGNFGVVYDGILKIDQQWKDQRRFSMRLNTLKQRVAVKKIGEATTLEGIQLREQILEDELKLMCRVGSHPNIVTLLGAVTADKEKLIIMDMCSVGDLKQFLKSKKMKFIDQLRRSFSDQLDIDRELYVGSDFVIPAVYRKLDPKGDWKNDLSKNITTAHLLSFAMQIARGMDYLTSMKCIHRDLAARNILLTPEGLCKIADFGLAKPIGYKEYYRTKTVQELPCRWMSLESLVYSIFTVESDIWSYGILLYEIFTLGGNPYPSLSRNLAEAIIAGARNDQPEYCPDVIFCHMKRCWSTELERRPSFKESADLMKMHLAKASTEVLSKVEKELQLEKSNQQEFAAMREAAHQKRMMNLLV